MAKPKQRYVCSSCGGEFPKWAGKCPDCGEWNTIPQEPIMVAAKKSSTMAGNSMGGIGGLGMGSGYAISTLVPKKFDEIETRGEFSRFMTGIREFDTVLGGGIVQGSVTLIGGEPGIGKSTIILMVASILAEAGHGVLYISGEESPSQIKNRAERLNATSKNISVLATMDIEQAISHLESGTYRYAIVDSVQSVSSSNLSSAAGTVTQVKHIAYQMMEIAKRKNITLFLIGQVTKDGAVAGPKVLEHLVDTVLYFEGDHNRGLRILRAVKNRFGSTDEVGVFEMSSQGLKSADASMFVSNLDTPMPGKVITPIMEGTRSFLVEVQALVSTTYYQYPKRTTVGFDARRLDMLMAVLDKYCNINLSSYDVYLNIAGGLRVNDPGGDLAICAAILSSVKDKPISSQYSFLGEVGLSGEISSVTNVNSRLSEAEKFGVTSIVGSERLEFTKSIKHVSIKYVRNLVQLIDTL